MGRVVTASLRGHSGQKYVILSRYGFPPSHPQRGLNEVLLSDACAYLSGLKRPAIVAGDLSDSLQSSPTLAMCTSIGVHDRTPNLPTTM